MSSLYIDKEALSTLAMARDGLLYPVTSLMNKKEAYEVDNTGLYKKYIFPFSFVLAPSGKRNKKVLESSKKNDRLELVCENKICGFIIVDEVFTISKDSRIQNIYGTINPEHPGVKDTYKRLGNLAICGKFEINFDQIKDNIKQIKETSKNLNAKNISTIILSGKPFHRVHERLVRNALVKSDLLVIFLRKSYKKEDLNYSVRFKILKYFCDNFLPKDRVLLLPFENTYIFGGVNELLLNAIVVKNYGIQRLIVSQKQPGLGVYWDKKRLVSIVDTIKQIDLNIDVMSEFVYCDNCKTLVSTNSCPHGSHHHVKYHNNSIMELFKLGIIPPAILMRKEISAIVLSIMYPEREDKLKKIFQDLSTSTGVIDEFKSEDFYEGLMNLYQTSSLT